VDNSWNWVQGLWKWWNWLLEGLLKWRIHGIDCKNCWSGQFMELIARIVEVMELIVARIVEMGDSWNYNLVMERTH
jgi:hypothetical protein